MEGEGKEGSKYGIEVTVKRRYLDNFISQYIYIYINQIREFGIEVPLESLHNLVQSLTSRVS